MSTGPTAGRPSVLAVGVICMDVVALVDGPPPADGRVEAADIVIGGGGPASTAAVALARQGVRTAVAGRVGDDEAGRRALASLRLSGIGTEGVRVDPDGATQISCVIVDRRRRTRSIITSHADPLDALTPGAGELARQADWIHADHAGYRAVASLLTEPTAGWPGGRPRVSLDAGNAPIEGLDLAVVDLFAPTRASLVARYGTEDADLAASRALAEGVHAVVATDGPRGCEAWWDEEGAGYARGSRPGVAGHARSPAYGGVGRVVSTLGAGDVFHGALLAGLLAGGGWPAALRRANVVAGLSCRARTARDGVPDQEEVDAALARIDG